MPRDAVLPRVAARGRALRAALRAGGAPPLAIHVLLPTRLDAFVVGALLAAWFRDPAAWARVTARMRGLAAESGPLWAARATMVLLALTLLGPTGQPLGVAIQLGALPVLAIGSAALIAAALVSPPDAALGKYSYGIYLLHGPVAWLLDRLILGGEDFVRFTGSALAGQLAFLAVAGGASVAAAVVCWHVVERPFLRLGDRLPYATGRGRDGSGTEVRRAESAA